MKEPKKLYDPKISETDENDSKEILLPQKDEFQLKADIQVWETYRKGDESAFIYIYQKYSNILINYGLQYFQHRVDAEDFVQDLFVDLRVKRDKMMPLKSSIKIYLLIALRNKIIDYIRKEKVKKKGLKYFKEEFEFVLPVEEELIKTQEYSEKINRLKKALEGLTDRQREAIYYLYYEGLSYSEISVLMNLNNVKSTRNMVYKAFNIVRKAISK